MEEIEGFDFSALRHWLDDRELAFLRYFYSRAEEGMGCASSEIYSYIKDDFINANGYIPSGYEDVPEL